MKYLALPSYLDVKLSAAVLQYGSVVVKYITLFAVVSISLIFLDSRLPDGRKVLHFRDIFLT
jgi:hypothetical protein